MNLWRTLAVCAIPGMAVMSACGGSSGAKGASAGSPTTKPAASSSSTTAGDQSKTAPASRAGSIDVCGLLSDADAADVASKAGLGEAGASYTLTATKVDQSSSSMPMSSCKFKIEASSGGGGTVQIDVVGGDNFASYKGSGTPVPGLGDEAVSTDGTTVVRVGNLMLETSEDSFTQKFVVELYRKMIPNLR